MGVRHCEWLRVPAVCVQGGTRATGPITLPLHFSSAGGRFSATVLGIRVCLTDSALITLLLGARYPLYALNKVTTARRDLNACFLTFHSLGAAPAAAHSADTELAFAARRQAAGPHAAFLPAFAFVPYKVRRVGF